MKEFNLSEKIELVLKFKGKKLYPVFDIKDVKEFIRLLKEELPPIDRIKRIIDKLAGDKLNGRSSPKNN